jgi:hypothetical protein
VAWSVIQSAGSASTAAAFTKAVTFSTANLSSGTKIIALVAVSSFSGAASITSVKDGAGNALTLIKSGSSGTGNIEMTGLFALDTPAGDVGSKPRRCRGSPRGTPSRR